MIVGMRWDDGTLVMRMVLMTECNLIVVAFERHCNHCSSSNDIDYVFPFDLFGLFAFVWIQPLAVYDDDDDECDERDD